MAEALEYVFSVCIGVGLAVPLLDMLVGIVGAAADLDLDIGDYHPGELLQLGGENGGLPLNIMCLCFSLVVFGALGRLAAGLMGSLPAAAACLLGLAAVSAGAYRLLYRFVVKPLKKNNPRAIKEWDLFGATGKLTLRVKAGSPGTVSLKDSTGALISYRAEAKKEVLENWGDEIPQGTEVTVVDVDVHRKIAYIKPVTSLQNYNRMKEKEI